MSLWDRSPVEDDEQFLWFQAYRDAIPPRQLGRLRAKGKVTPPLQTLLNWYNELNWRDRAAAWDKHLDTLRQTERESLEGQTAKDHATRHQALLNDVTELVERELDKMLKTSVSSDMESLKPGEVNKLLDSAIKLGRLVRGESTETVTVQQDASKLSDEELRTLIALHEKMKK